MAYFLEHPACRKTQQYSSRRWLILCCANTIWLQHH